MQNRGSSLHFSSGDEVFEDGLQMSEEDGGVTLGEEQAGTESHGRLSAGSRIHTCNNKANISVQYTAIHICNNTADVSVQYKFTPATTQPTSMSSERNICNNRANINVQHTKLKQQSQHQRPVHVHTCNNRANINVKYTLTPTTTEPTSVSITHSHQQ